MVSKNHIARGIEAVIDGANVTKEDDVVDVWVPKERAGHAIEIARDLGENAYRPEAYPGRYSDRIALRL